MVATYPQLEYPRRWPSHVHVTGPMLFELPHPGDRAPGRDAPLVLVAGSTAQDQELRLVRTAIRAFEGEPVQVLVSLNQQGRTWPDPVPENVTVVDWVSYSQVLPRASAIVCNGGHGTVVRALSEGVPLVVCPAGGDMGENGARVAWSGAGLMLPWGLLGPARCAGPYAGCSPTGASPSGRGGSPTGVAKTTAPARGAELLERYVDGAG